MRALKKFTHETAPSVVQGQIFALYLGIYVIFSLNLIFQYSVVKKSIFFKKQKFTKVFG